MISGLSALAGNPGTPLPPDSLGCDTLWLKSGKIMLVTIISQNNSEIKFSDCPPTEIVSTIPRSATKLSPRDSALAAQRASMCDTIYLKSGEVIAGHMKFYNSRKVVYTGCCENCTSEKSIKRNDVDSIVYVDGRIVGSKNPNNNTTNNQSTNPVIEKNEPPEEKYTPEEKEEAKKKSKIFGIIGLAAGLPIAITGVLLLVFVATTNPIGFGLIFFGGIILGLAMAMLYVKNRKKAGLKREKKRNKKKD